VSARKQPKRCSAGSGPGSPGHCLASRLSIRRLIRPVPLESVIVAKKIVGITQHTEITIDQVAKAAKVSPATVSRVLNGTAKVSAEKEKAVRKAVAKYNFTPNATARRLAGGRSGLIALLMEESSEEFFLNPFWGQVVQGFSTAITDAGLHPLLLIRPKSRTEDSLFSTLQAGQMDGLAIFSWHRPLKSFEKMLDPKMAVVFGGDLGGSKKYPYVDVDNVKGGYLATKHLIDSGCRNIVTITGDLKLQSGRDRLDGYEKAITSAGMKLNDQLIIHGDYTQSKAEELCRQLIKSKIKFDGVFAGNDLSALGVINVLLQNGISVPNKVKVVGFDDSPVASRNQPSITTIRQPIRELGAQVALSLLAVLDGQEVEDKVLDVKLVKRQSSATK
jgi:DNA-binding LacI/PurR family transcriptional regulator